MSRSDVDDLVQVAAAEKREVKRDLRQALLSGLALTVPFFITILVLGWALDVAASVLEPVAGAVVALGLAQGSDTLLLQALAAVAVFGLVLVVGLAAQHGPNTQLGTRIDAVMEDIPGIGSIYTSVERMSDVIVEGDTESFREVKLVEFPHEGSYVLAFLTADAPRALEAAAGGRELLTVFVPLAPNPVMGGHLVNLPPDRIYDVDMTVEEGMQAIMTTGIAVDKGARDEAAVPEGATGEGEEVPGGAEGATDGAVDRGRPDDESA